MDRLARRVPTGPGRGGAVRLDGAALDRVLATGAAEVVRGLGLGGSTTWATPSWGASIASSPARRSSDEGRAYLAAMACAANFA